MIEDKLLDATNRAARAQQLLNDELLTEAFNQIESDLVNAWASSDPRDAEGRELAWHAVQSNRKQRDYLVSVVTNGKMAQAELKALIEKRQIASLTEAELEALFEEAAMECALRDVAAKIRKEGKIPDLTKRTVN